MKIRPFIYFILSAAFALVFGCAPSVTHLQKHLDKGNFDKALEAVADDPSMQIELAALILERAASRGVQTTELIGVLKRSVSPGDRALKRLEEKSSDPAKSLAKIALIGRHPPEGKELLAYLEHDHSDIRAESICAWKKELTLDQLASMVIDQDHRTRRCALEGVLSSESKDQTRKESLLGEALRLDPEASVRRVAASAGKQLGDDAYLKLKSALEDENTGVRLAALEGLSEIGDERAIAVLEDVSAGPMDELAIAAASELSRLGKEAGKRRLLEALEDNRPTMRQAALLRTERARIQNRDELFAKALEDEAPKVILLAASSLSKKETFEAPVKKTLKKIVELGIEASEEARDMLAVMGDKESRIKVEEILKTASAKEVLRVLARVKQSDDLRPVFVGLMADSRMPIRIAASSALLASVKNRQ